MKIKLNNNKGFTIIELLLAVFILAIGIIAVFGTFPLGINVVRSGKMTTIATQLAQAKLEEEFSKTYNEISIGISTEDYGDMSDFNNFKRVTEVNCVEPVDLTEVACDYDPVNDVQPLKKVEVTVFWKSSLTILERDLKLATLISKK